MKKYLYVVILCVLAFVYINADDVHLKNGTTIKDCSIRYIGDTLLYIKTAVDSQYIRIEDVASMSIDDYSDYKVKHGSSYLEDRKFYVGYLGIFKGGEYGGIIGSTSKDPIGFCGFVTVGANTDYKDYPNISESDSKAWQDRFQGTYEKYTSIGLGVSVKATEQVSLLFCGMASSRTTYNNYYDKFEILGNNGKYSVDVGDDMVLGIMGAIKTDISPNVSFIIGGSFKPTGFVGGLCIEF